MPRAALSTLERDATLDRLEGEAFDCAVIGGGITGAGVAREASLRGLRVALLEARDFASGTSSRSSKLIHGGLRYLAMGDVPLVRATALERKVIHRMAPHLAEPRWMVVPTRSRAGLMKLRAAITTYEKLGAVEDADLHRNWGRDELAEHEPLLDRERYAHACVYREYLTDDARLVLANLRDAVRAGATAANHAPVVEITATDGAADGVVAECSLSGRRVHVSARCVINAAGPWVDAIRALEEESAPPRLLLSKGVHIVIPASRLPARNLLILNTDDRRTIFVLPRGSSVYVGTTDTVYEPGSEVWPTITREDVEYLLAPVNRDLRGDPLRIDDVSGAWSGLRPLIGEPGKKPSEISRKDEVWIGPKRVVTIAGGKLTGYRPMAHMTLERAAEVCDLPLAPGGDDESALPGGDFDGDLGALAASLEREHGVSATIAERLAALYGSEASEVAGLGREPVAQDSETLCGEVEFAVKVDAAATLKDVVYRRTRAGLYDPAREAVLEPMARRMAELLGWDEARIGEEIATCRGRLREDLVFLEESAA